jgi:DNA-binding CsgD family transcriptional regulator
MDYLTSLSKSDLISLLDISYDVRVARESEEFKNCFQKLKDLLLFDGAACTHLEKDGVDNPNCPFFGHTLDMPEKVAEQFIRNRYVYKSAAFKIAYNTGLPQIWEPIPPAKCMGMDCAQAMEFAHTNRVPEGWMSIHQYPNYPAISVFAIAGRKVEKDKRTNAVLRYITPHFSESLKDTFHSTAKDHKATSEYTLTPREVEVLEWIKDGKTTWEIGIILNRSERVIKYHVKNIMHKLNAQNRTHSVAIAMRAGLLD